VSSDGTIGRSHTGSPSPSSAYQSGIGTPKNRWRLTSQSPLRPRHPRFVASLHVWRHPVELRATDEQLFAQIVVATAVADVPLTRRHDLERLVAAFVELDRVRDCPRFADEFAVSRRIVTISRCAPAMVLPAIRP
jgi:hypothetical protein